MGKRKPAKEKGKITIILLWGGARESVGESGRNFGNGVKNEILKRRDNYER